MQRAAGTRDPLWKRMDVKARSLVAGVALALPAVIGTVLLVRSGLGGDDFEPVRWLATGGPAYGENYLYAYPLPVYLPALPLAALPVPVSQAVVLALCFALIGQAGGAARRFSVLVWHWPRSGPLMLCHCSPSSSGRGGLICGASRLREQSPH